MTTFFSKVWRMAAAMLRQLLLATVDRDRSARAELGSSRQAAIPASSQSSAIERSSQPAPVPATQPKIAHLELEAQLQAPAQQPDPIEEAETESHVAPEPMISEPPRASAAPPSLATESGVSQTSNVAPVAASDVDEMPLVDGVDAAVGKGSPPLVSEPDTAAWIRPEEPLSNPEPAEQPDFAAESVLNRTPLPQAVGEDDIEPFPTTDTPPDVDAGNDDVVKANAHVGQVEDAPDGTEAEPVAETPQQPEPIGEEAGSGIRDEISFEPMPTGRAVSAAEIENVGSEEVESGADESAEPDAVSPDALTVKPEVAVRDGEADDEVVSKFLDEARQAVANVEISQPEVEQDTGVEDVGHVGASLASNALESNEVLDEGHEIEVDADEAADLDHPLEDAGIGSGIARQPSVYRPRLNRARAQRTPAAATTGTRDFQDLDAELQIFFGPGDWGLEIWALLRLPASTDEVAIFHDGEETWLGALDDQLLEPLALSDNETALGQPLLITADMPVRWSRSSRDLHIFGQHPTVAGFVSRARVVIGQENAVICRDGLADEALAQILATGSAEPVMIKGPGVPEGWTCWRGVRPARPSAPSGGLQILHALDPLPAVTVELAGGLQLSRGTWLEGNPPSIRLLGLISERDPVLIDRHAAVRDDDGRWTADGWDRVGAHRVEHGGVTASYAIDSGINGWDWWPAWHGATSVAGALAAAGGGEYFHVGQWASLIGARPGEICGFSPAAHGVCVTHPDFEPVWRITAGAGMRRAKASAVGMPSPPAAPFAGSPAATARWVRAICASAKAGTRESPERRLWDRYVVAARMYRRQSR